MEDQPSTQPTETLAQPYLRAGQALIAELGARVTPTVLAETETPAETASIATERLAIGTLDTMRLFVQEKREQTQEAFRSLRKDPKRLVLLGALGAAVAAAKPVVEAGLEKVPVIQMIDGTEVAQAKLHGVIPNVPSYESGEYQGDGGYPYANAPPGTTDEMGYRYDQCTGYARWREMQNGVSSARLALTYDIERLRSLGEVVDRNPAVGAIAMILPARQGESGHMMYVEAYDDETGDVWVSEWNNGGNRYSMRRAPANDYTLDGSGNFYYVHFELPAPSQKDENNSGTFQEAIKPAQRFMGTKYDRRNKDSIRMNHVIKRGTFIQSESGRFRLVFDKAGSGIKLWDVKEDYKVTWRKFLRGKTANQLRIKRDTTRTSRTRGKSSHVHQNLLTLGTRKKDFMRIPIGNATRVVLEDDGTFSGYRGRRKTPVWKEAVNPARIARVAKAAAHRAAQARRR